MSRALVAGVGNIFLGDDGFGVEVSRRLAEAPLPDGIRVMDAGVRTLHLAYELLEPFDLLVVVDAVDRGGAPGTLYVLEIDSCPARSGASRLDADQDGGGRRADAGGAHGMDIDTVLAMVQALGGRAPRTLVLGCQPARLHEQIGLSTEVTAAVGVAVGLVRELLDRELGREAGHSKEDSR